MQVPIGCGLRLDHFNRAFQFLDQRHAIEETMAETEGNTEAEDVKLCGCFASNNWCISLCCSCEYQHPDCMSTTDEQCARCRRLFNEVRPIARQLINFCYKNIYRRRRQQTL